MSVICCFSMPSSSLAALYDAKATASPIKVHAGTDVVISGEVKSAAADLYDKVVMTLTISSMSGQDQQIMDPNSATPVTWKGDLTVDTSGYADGGYTCKLIFKAYQGNDPNLKSLEGASCTFTVVPEPVVPALIILASTIVLWKLPRCFTRKTIRPLA